MVRGTKTYSGEQRHTQGIIDKTQGINYTRMWDAGTGTLIGKPMEGHSNWVTCVAFAPSGTQIASGSDDRTVRRWDVTTGKPIGEPLRGHSRPILSVAFLPDGRWIASGSADCLVRLWDARSGEAIGEPLNAHLAGVSTVTFSPDGKALASGCDNGMIRFWQCGPGRLENQPRLSSSCPPTAPLTPPQRMLNPSHLSSSIQHESPSSNLPPREALKLNKEGWITGPNDELILWVPPGLRNKVPFSEQEVIDHFDFTNFKCGTEWTGCWGGSREAQAA